jgi:stage II sporulation protein GA (sporulation sigma-E factor processing peptidase)
MKTVYIDVLFLINFALDYMTLYLGGIFLRHRMMRARLILTSVILALYAVWALLWCRSYLLLLCSGIFAFCIGCTVAYRIRSVRVLLKTCLICGGIAALLGACVYLLHRLLSAVIPQRINGNGGGMKIVVFTILAGISGILIYFGNRLITDVRGVKCVDVSIRLIDKPEIAHLMVDTGNLVTDPISGRRVVFLSSQSAKRMFGRQIQELDFLPTRRRWLCISGATGKQTVPAFLPLEIKMDGKRIEALVAIPESGDYHGYDGLFPASLLP